MTYSNSKLSCFESCPLKYNYQYIQKLEKPSEETVEQFLGIRVHEALERLYKDLKFQKLDTLPELLESYNSEWKKNWNPGIILVRKEYSGENYRKMGEKYLSDYYSRYHPFNQARTLGLEHKISLSLDPEGKYRMTGVIDRLSCRDDGTYEIHDYKTGVLTPHSYLETERQLPLYALAIKHHYRDARTVNLIWHFLSADKEVVLTRTDEQLESLKKEIIQLIDDIESRKEIHEFPARRSTLCDWCQFRSVCPEWGHIARTENLPPNEYLDEPGVKLVNEYASLSLQRQKFLEDIEPRLERLKEALVTYSEKNKVRVIAGSDSRATVWSAEVIKAPNRNEPGREELEALIKRLGLWHDTSSLDTFSLSRIIQERKWPQEFLDKLMPYLRKEKISRIYLKPAENHRGE
jgi:putative RecB family exonuclease